MLDLSSFVFYFLLFLLFGGTFPSFKKKETYISQSHVVFLSFEWSDTIREINRGKHIQIASPQIRKNFIIKRSIIHYY